MTPRLARDTHGGVQLQGATLGLRAPANYRQLTTLAWQVIGHRRYARGHSLRLKNLGTGDVHVVALSDVLRGLDEGLLAIVDREDA